MKALIDRMRSHCSADRNIRDLTPELSPELSYRVVDYYRKA